MSEKLKKHPRHLYYAVEDGVLWSVYHTIRGERTMEIGFVEGFPDKDRLEEKDFEEVEKIIKPFF